MGSFALQSNTSGSINTAVGQQALTLNTSGSFNTAVGQQALQMNSGDRNTAAGVSALVGNVTGHDNTAVGFVALGSNVGGSNNVALGAHAGSGVTTASNVICIGANVAGNDVNDSCYIGNIFGDTSSGGTAVFVNSNGRLGTSTSSRRIKEEIKPMERASEALFALKPVAFRAKKEIDPAGTPQLGLVAEEVEKVNPDLVVRDKDGKPYSVRYDQVNAMLLNEFLKEHKRVEELNPKAAKRDATITELKSMVAKQEAMIVRQQKAMEAFTVQLKKQDAEVQKVSAQIQTNKPAPQMVVNR